ncbi:endonuclease I family protein [Abyssalbus ytuae]|uniref:Endonuclease n=1 Tax=Abyssalbus ytuae TaxID=2926907 RepID=A0A9E7CZS4_9FLAO|nr:endonuclease [Abyssalbus ytuae]UOB17815.1 endonuclease [Abyssalbus ytuae]
MKKSSIWFLLLFTLLSCKTNNSGNKEIINSNISNTISHTEDKGIIAQDSSSPFNIPKAIQKYYSGLTFPMDNKKLYEELAAHTISKHTNFLGYGERHKYLYNIDEDPQNEKNVILIYSGNSRNKKEYSSGKNPHKIQTFNTEHVYPQSKIQNTARGDLHHLRVCDQKINSQRSNHPFTEGKGVYKLINGNSWYPGDEWKGDVARMIMYLNLRYNEPFSEVGNLDLFLKWNAEDTVSEIEKQRNMIIEKVQGNRNPFIDNPYLATFIWGGKKAENRWE